MAATILPVSGIYSITNKVNGKKYIGSAVNFKRRFRKHMYELLRQSHHSEKLQRAWNKYGTEAFEFSVLEEVSFHSDLIIREQFWIDMHDSAAIGYNMSPTAGSNLGTKRSPETLLKMRISGLKYVASSETREKLRIANTGKKASPEKLAKMRALVKSPATLEKLRVAGIGRKLSEDSISKIIAFHTGSKRTEEAKEKMRMAKLGTKQTEETKAKMTIAQNMRRERERLCKH